MTPDPEQDTEQPLESSAGIDLPAGDLTFSRVVTDASAALTAALDRRHTGYGVFTPSDALVLDDETHAVIGFQDGIPHYALTEDDAGSGALAAAATPGPLRVALHECHATLPRDEARIAPDTPARRLAGNDELARRTVEAAPDDLRIEADSTVPDAGDDLNAVDAFLADEDAIARIKEQARNEAERRAREWGFDEFTDGSGE